MTSTSHFVPPQVRAGVGDSAEAPASSLGLSGPVSGSELSRSERAIFYGTLLVATEPVFLSGTVGVLIALALLSVGLWYTRPRFPYRFHPLIVLMCGLFIASVAWSDLPSLTLARALIFSLAAASAVQFGTRATLAEVIHLLVIGFFLVSVVCVVLAVLVPSVGLDTEYRAGTVKGFFFQKNLFAYAMLLGVLAAAFDTSLSRPVKSLTIVWFLLLMFSANSSTAIVVLAATSAAVAVLRLISGTHMWRVTVAMLLIITSAGVIVGFSNFEVVTGAVGRDAGLTGRTEIWNAALTVGERNPVLGVGWGAVWDIGSPAGESVRWRSGLAIYHAHNTPLDVWLQVGLGGAALIVLMVLVVLVQGVRRGVGTGAKQDLWIAAIGIVLVIYSIDEVRATKLLGWWLLCMCLTFCSRPAVAASGAGLENAGRGAKPENRRPLL